MPTPRATYRLQLTPALTFADAARLVPYLRDLGISHLYLSPIAEATRGSAHGYDVTDPTRIRAELGGEAGFRVLAAAVREHGLGILLDIVPNHVAASTENPFWRDVLARGLESEFAPWFEIRWGENGGRVVLPVLSAPRDELERSGELVREGGELRWHAQRFPLPETHYELAFWKEGMRRVNWRRYLDVNELVCLRMHDEHVFSATHELPLRLVREGLVDGLRVDHVDGLLDPTGYVRRLRAAAGPACWIVVERSTEPPDGWPVDGTTGYDFLGCALALMHDPDGLATLRTAHRAFVGAPPEDRSELQRFVAEELLGPECRAARGDLARLRQLVVAIGAKAIEDTLLYRDGALLSLCELGVGDPDAELEPREATLSRLRARGPRTLNATQTHDTKRGEDVRARLAALTQVAGRFVAALGRWREINAVLRCPCGPHFEWLIYQTLLGAWPIAPDRLCRYLVKAAREAKQETSWHEPNAAYEEELCRFARSLLAHGPFLDEFEPFAADVAERGAVLSLAQLGLKLTTPGVVDIYQGCELWDLSLVDPDNRRPVDFDLRRRMLAELDTIDVKKLPPLDPRHKLKLLRDGLRLR